jgi:hypothetical protein
MKPIQLQIVSGGKITEKWNMASALHLRLVAFAQENGGISKMEMIERSMRFAMEPEDKQPDLVCPEEEDIVEFAADVIEAISGKR